MKRNRKPKQKTAKTKSSYQIQLLCEACILSNHTKQIGTYSCTTPNPAIAIITANTNNNSNKFIFASCQCRCHTHFRLNFKLQACCWQFYLVNWYSWENCAHNAYRSQFQFKCKFHTMIPICEQTNNNRKKKQQQSKLFGNFSILMFSDDWLMTWTKMSESKKKSISSPNRCANALSRRQATKSHVH